MPDADAISPNTPIPALNDSPVDPIRANAVIVVPKSDMTNRNEPMPRDARK